MPGSAERWIWRGGAGRPDNAWTIGTLVIARAGRDAAKIGRDDREHHGGDHHGPREREHPDDVVRALLETRAVGEPDDEAEDEAEDRTDDSRRPCRWR